MKTKDPLLPSIDNNNQIKCKTKSTKKTHTDKNELKQYIHAEKRTYNPPVGLVTPDTDKEASAKKYSFDPHIDPQLQWTGKRENSEIEINTVSLHVHERIDPLTIIEKAIKKQEFVQQTLLHYFEMPENNPPLREAIEFYKHDQNWSNRLIAGDSLLVMNSFLQKENFGGKIQMVYVDPPYGISYGSNFQPFVNKRDVRDGRDEDLTRELEEIKAFRDTWELGVHSYLTYLRNRLLLVRDLLTESGSCFVQISDENIHLVRCLMDEVFGRENFCSMITFRKKMMPLGSDVTESISDYILWYCKNREKVKTHPLFKVKKPEGDPSWSFVELADGTRRKLTSQEISNHNLLPENSRVFQSISLLPAQYRPNQDFQFQFQRETYNPPKNNCWKTDRAGMEKLAEKNRLIPSGNTLRYVFYHEDYPVSRITNLWADTAGADDQRYVVQTNTLVIQRCILMTTDPGDLVFDPTCGGGTSAYVAEKWGRRWITCDTSRIAIAITKQRLMTSIYDYFELVRVEDGVKSGFLYKTIPHVTLSSITNSETPGTEILYDQPIKSRTKKRISGPFTVEAVPSPIVKSADTLFEESVGLTQITTRNEETYRQDQWRNELLKNGIRGKGGQKIEFSRVEVHPVAKYLHAEAETKEAIPKRVAISFGHEYAPLEQRQVALAIEESQFLVPRPQMVIFAALQFDPEAAKDIDEINWPGVTILKVQMNADLLTEDLKKEHAHNESFWLMGQPDIELIKCDDKKYVVEVKGFDYYNAKTGNIESGDSSRIAMWMLDTDYDGRSVYPQQAFFPMSGKTEAWEKIAKTVGQIIDEELIKKYNGTVSIPFSPAQNKRIAVKVIDDRGIESLRILRIE